MSWLSKLFGKKEAPQEVEPEMYFVEGYGDVTKSFSVMATGDLDAITRFKSLFPGSYGSFRVYKVEEGFLKNRFYTIGMD